MSLALMILFLGIANWLGTTILVESEITRDYREWIGKRKERAQTKERFFTVNPPLRRKAWAWNKLHYFVQCHLCTGTWVGMVMALFVVPIVSTPFVGWVLTGLVIKGIGHLFLVIHKAGEAWTQHQSEQGKALAHFRDAREKVDA